MHHAPQTTSGRWSQRALPANLEIGAAIEPQTTPRRSLPSVPAAWIATTGWRQPSPQPFCVANTLNAACACLVCGAAVPWNLYRLKRREMQSGLTFD
jgi:hypothetical protein